MPLTYGPYAKPVDISIDHARCSMCGSCVTVCHGGPLYKANEHIEVDLERGLGCIGCGQCASTCPKDCIRVTGCGLTPEDVLPILPKSERASYEGLHGLMLARRSIRFYQDREVEDDLVTMIVDSASTAPMGLPPSEVRLIVFQGRRKVQEFAGDIVGEMERAKWLQSKLFLLWMKLTAGRETEEMMREFIVPVCQEFIKRRKAGEDLLCYDAPLAIYFWSPLNSDPADATIAATYAMLAAESLGLGSCMLGTPGLMLRYGASLKAKYGLPKKFNPGLVVIFGHPATTFRRGVRRHFANVEYR